MNGGVLFVADPHYGLATHGTIREAEAYRVAAFIHAEARKRGAGVVVLGDTFHNRHPAPWAYVAASMLPNGTVLLPGNHDSYEEEERKDPLDALAEQGWFHIPRSVEVKVVGGIALVLVPWFGRAHMAARGGSAAEQFRAMDSALGALVQEAVASIHALPIVVCVHTSIAGAAYNSGVQPMLGEAGEFFASLGSVARSEALCVMAGHIHKPQELPGGSCPVHYVGSAVRVDFGEEGQTCRAIHLTPEGEMEDVPLPATDFLTIDVNESGGFCHSQVKGKVVRLKGELPAGPETAALLRELTARIEAGKPAAIGRPAIKVVRADASGEHHIHIEQSPGDALAEFCDLAGGDFATRKDELLSLHSTLNREAEAT